jgi:MYXO-CTERM domain-containing protein
MHRITLTIILVLSATAVDAASYEKIDGAIIDPIIDIGGDVLSYVGPNLEPSANLSTVVPFADLTGASLNYADLSGANLSGSQLQLASLTGARLYNADLSNADLIYADLSGANLSGANLTSATIYLANFSDANLSGADFYNVTDLTNTTWTDAFFDYRNEPTWASVMDATWRSSAGILRTTPEPSTLLLALLGLALLPRRRRR